MKSKYYKPSIKEFCIGFEYEILSSNSDIQACVFNYDKEVFSENANITGYIHDLNINKIRTKYLDKEDIESLGFKLFNGEDVFEKSIKEYRGRLNLKCHIILRKSILIMIGDDETPWMDWNVIFTGIIKNKSELKKLLMQLEIINE